MACCTPETWSGGPNSVRLVCLSDTHNCHDDVDVPPGDVLIHAGDAHRLMTNIAFGGPENKTLFITDSLNGNIMTAELPIAGKTMYGLS